MCLHCSVVCIYICGMEIVLCSVWYGVCVCVICVYVCGVSSLCIV